MTTESISLRLKELSDIVLDGVAAIKDDRTVLADMARQTFDALDLKLIALALDIKKGS